MKNILAIIALLGIAIPCLSQNPIDYSERKNEINIGYFNAFELNGINELGVGYKRIISNGAFRTGIGFNFSQYDHENETEQWKNSGFEFSPRIGYEFHQYFNRLRLHYGTDVVSSFINSTSEYIAENPISNRTDKSNGFQIGLRPILGLTVFINKSISLATETYLDLSFYKSTEERIRSNGTTTSTEKGMNMGLGPLGIVSVNFHF